MIDCSHDLPIIKQVEVQTRQDEQTPDESTVRRKVALVWRELRAP